MTDSLADTTWQSYQRTWEKFDKFSRLTLKKSLTLPIPFQELAWFIAYLDQEKLAYSTILSTLSGLAFWHKIKGLPDPTKHFMITRMLTGIRNKKQKVDMRMPITVPILEKLVDAVPKVIPYAYEAAMLTCIFTLAFHALLRIGEMLPRCTKSSGPKQVLTSADIAIASAKDQKEMTVCLRKFKHSGKQGPQTIKVCSLPNKKYCPVDKFTRFKMIRGKKAGPLFVRKDGSPYSTSMFNRDFTQIIEFCGLNPKHYKSHSFRIGAASEACARGCTDTQIRNMGRWHSDAFLKYIRMSAAHFSHQK